MLCRMYRWIAACAIDSDGHLGAATQRHLGSCAQCRRYYHTQQQVNDALEQQASQVTLPASHLLPNRILASVSPGDPARHQPRVFRVTRFRTIAACLLVALALMIPVLRMQPNSGSTSNPDPSALTRMATLLQQAVPGQLKSAHTFLVQDSLESEMIKLSTDARRAVRFLVQCTPSHGRTSPDE